MLLTYKEDTVELPEDSLLGPLLSDLIAEYHSAENFAAKLKDASGDPDLLLRAAMLAEGKCAGLERALRAVIQFNEEVGLELPVTAV